MSQITCPRLWHRDKPISAGLLLRFSQAPEKTAPVSGVPCAPLNVLSRRLALHLLPAATCQLQGVRSEDKRLSAHSLKAQNIPLSDTIFAFDNW